MTDTAPEGGDALQLQYTRVRASFDRASADYDKAAVVQSRVRAELTERLTLFQLEPRVILDLGAGTGFGARQLRQRYRLALVVALDSAPGMLRQARHQLRIFRKFERVCADARGLPIATASVDLVFSNLMLQWCNELAPVLQEVKRVLKPGGLFAFSTFGPDTLHELRTAWGAADAQSHVNRFLDMHDVGDAVARAGLAEPVLDVERIRVTYPHAMALMHDLKAIGARNATAGRPRGLIGRRRLQRMQQAYEAFRREGQLPATYEVIYGMAWGTASRPVSSVIAGEVRIPVGAIRSRE